MSIPKDIEPSCITAIIDTREQCPLDLSPLRTVSGTLATGDYSVVGLENTISIERKSLADLLGCMGGGRERFERELQRMLGYPTRCVVVEADWCSLLAGTWNCKITSASAMGSVLGWIAGGVPFLFAGDHEAAGKAVSRMLFIAARRRWREARGLMDHVLASPIESGVPS